MQLAILSREFVELRFIHTLRLTGPDTKSVAHVAHQAAVESAGS
jgi:hypothetical protein